MADTHYWTSLWVLGLIIVLSLVGISLIVSFFSFLYDRISTYEIWNSPVWLKLRTPVIVLGVAFFFVALLAYIRAEGYRELRTAQDYAQAHGWAFSRSDSEELGLTAKVAEILTEYKFQLYYIRTVEAGPQRVYLFDCSYKNRDASGRKNDSYGTACMVRSDRIRSGGNPVEISSRDWTEVMIPDKVEMEETPFAREFLVQSKDPDTARMIVNRSIQAILLDHMRKPVTNPVSVIIGPGGTVVMTGRTAEHERLQDLVELARKMESAAK